LVYLPLSQFNFQFPNGFSPALKVLLALLIWLLLSIP